MSASAGLRANAGQFALQLLQVFCVGALLGSTRTVVPALAEAEFGVARGSFALLAIFVVVFGVVKAALNFVAGRAADVFGRRRVLIAGWLVALPVPVLLYLAPGWNWVVAATVLLGVNQGLAWSATQAAKLDLAGDRERGRALGLDEFAGYLGVALAGAFTAASAEAFGARLVVAATGGVAVLGALATAAAWMRETAHGATNGAGARFAHWSWRVPRMLALNQAGLVEKWADALVWIALPPYLYARGVPLAGIGAVAGVYGVAWGAAQLVTGHLSDRWGRDGLIVGGMWLCGAGLGTLPLFDTLAAWLACAAVGGLGMAMLYPNLAAAVGDLAPAAERGTALGAYRFWRDLGYAIGALAIAAAAELAGGYGAAFALVGAALLVSGALVPALSGRGAPQRATP